MWGIGLRTFKSWNDAEVGRHQFPFSTIPFHPTGRDVTSQPIGDFFGKILKMILFHAHAFPAKSLEKGAKTEVTPVFRRRWHQTLPPPSSTGKLPPHCDLKGRCTFRHVTVFCWYLSPVARQGNIQKNLEFQNSGYNPPKGGLLF